MVQTDAESAIGDEQIIQHGDPAGAGKKRTAEDTWLLHAEPFSPSQGAATVHSWRNGLGQSGRAALLSLQPCCKRASSGGLVCF